MTQSGLAEMVRKGRWELVFDELGDGKVYDVEADPDERCEIYADPRLGGFGLDLSEELLRWTVRTLDDLPGARYHVKTAPHGWYNA